MKKTLREVAEIMINNGISPIKVKEVLIDLGFPKNKVEEIVAKYSILNPPSFQEEKSLANNDIEKLSDRLVIEEEIKRQRAELEKLEQDLMKLIVEVSNLNRKVKALEEVKLSKSVEEKILNLEAKFNAFIDVILEHAPQLLDILKSRGVR